MKNILRTILIFLSGVSFLCFIVAPLIGSYMQNRYKDLLSIAADTEAVLEKKRFWTSVGETKIFLIVFLAFLGCLLTAELIFWLKRSKKSM